ncbi:MAG: hypothetical protein JNM81_05050, partial [Rhodospirillaceae bacterium]|nr:hypothetical protein [Rhodospirillaceae bacterium]
LAQTSGSDAGEIKAELVGGDAICQIRVSDNGVGLPAHERHRLTEPYVTTRTKGTGLGLAIVKKIVEDHGGTVTLDDAPVGSGALVTLTLAAAKNADTTSRPENTVHTPLRANA